MDTLRTIAAALIVIVCNISPSYGIPGPNDITTPQGQEMNQKRLRSSVRKNGGADDTSKMTKKENPVDLRRFLSPHYDSIVDLTLPDYLKIIPQGAFKGGSNLRSITLPKFLTTICNYAFKGCSNLKNITLSCPSLGFIGCFAFENCKKLESIILSSPEVIIGYKAFNNCQNIEKIVVPSQLGNRVWNPLLFYELKDELLWKKNIERDLVIFYKTTVFFIQCWDAQGVKYEIKLRNTPVISEKCFSLSLKTRIRKIEIPEGVTKIDDYALESCENLKAIILPDSLSVIGAHAFERCKSLETIILPNSVKEIGDLAFYLCESLKYFICQENSTLKQMGMDMFLCCINLVEIRVPSHLVITFWKCFKIFDGYEKDGITKKYKNQKFCEMGLGDERIWKKTFKRKLIILTKREELSVIVNEIDSDSLESSSDDEECNTSKNFYLTSSAPLNYYPKEEEEEDIAIIQEESD